MAEHELGFKRGQRIDVRCLGDQWKIVSAWDCFDGTVYVTDEIGIIRLEAGDQNCVPIGLPVWDARPING